MSVGLQMEATDPKQAWNMIDLSQRITAETITKWGFLSDKRCTDLNHVDLVVKYMNAVTQAGECSG